MHKYEESSRLSRKQIIINNFLGGISWGLGATIGLSIVVALLGLIASHIGLIPVVGTFVSGVLDFVLKHNNTFQH